jgi:hypothetical protein
VLALILSLLSNDSAVLLKRGIQDGVMADSRGLVLVEILSLIPPINFLVL